ncbi:hypothetical protein, partial [Burkholderia glumae]|uniref:hypothetical protein n=1 Tax=Burkholderia glumae TaxID=337 RepID=UPI001C8938D2
TLIEHGHVASVNQPRRAMASFKERLPSAAPMQDPALDPHRCAFAQFPSRSSRVIIVSIRDYRRFEVE